MDPVIVEMDINAQAMMTLSITSTGDTDVLAFVEDELKTEPMPNTNNANTINSAETGRLRASLVKELIA